MITNTLVLVLSVIVQVEIQTERQEHYLLLAEAIHIAAGGFGPRLLTIAAMLPLCIPLGAAILTIAITQGFA